jgi:hypothetical protein
LTSLPQPIADLVSQATNHIDQQGELSISYRAQLHRSIEAESLVEHPRSGYYRRCKWEIATAARVLPIWVGVGQSDRDLQKLLRLASSALRSEVSLESLQSARDAQWEQLVELGHRRPEMQTASAAALATVAAATTVLYDIDIGSYEATYAGGDPEHWEAAFYAAIAVAGGATWNNEGDSSLRRGFWLQHVEVALAEIWPASTAPVEAA